jgi:hypothetical protein
MLGPYSQPIFSVPSPSQPTWKRCPVIPTWETHERKQAAARDQDQRTGPPSLTLIHLHTLPARSARPPLSASLPVSACEPACLRACLPSCLANALWAHSSVSTLPT